MTESTTIDGDVEPGFEAVADAFAANFRDRGEVGAAVAAYVDGRKVIDLWGGLADPAAGRAWTADSVPILFSMTKGVSTILALRLLEQGLLDLDAPVATYWPEYGTAGKEHTTVRHLLSHRAGLPAVDGPVSWEDLADPSGMAARLAAQEPVFEPGTHHVYQAITFGWLVGEVIRRASGLSYGEALQREVVGPLGLDLWVGLPEEQEDRVAPIQPPDIPVEIIEAVMPEGSMPWRIMTLNGLMPVSIAGPGIGMNDRRWRAAEVPSANLMATARSVARMYAATIGEVDGVRLLQAETVADATIVRSDGPQWDGNPDQPSWGTGFLLPFPRQPQLGPRSFGHDGAGGPIGFADPERGASFAHTLNQMQVHFEPDPRTTALVDAYRTCLDT